MLLGLHLVLIDQLLQGLIETSKCFALCSLRYVDSLQEVAAISFDWFIKFLGWVPKVMLIRFSYWFRAVCPQIARDLREIDVILKKSLSATSDETFSIQIRLEFPEAAYAFTNRPMDFDCFEMFSSFGVFEIRWTPESSLLISPSNHVYSTPLWESGSIR